MPIQKVQEAHDALLKSDTDRGGFNAAANPKAHHFGKEPHGHSRYKICVSGAAETGHCGLDAYELGKELGREIVRQGCVIVTGATTGMPLYAAVGAKEEGGLSIGFSPAANEREHIETYNLPVDYMDVIVYTGFGFPGRDLLLTRSSDAVVLGCGRIGTIHEFTIAYEDKKPVGVLEGMWETDEVLRHLISASNRPVQKIVFDSEPKALLERLIEMVKEDKKQHQYVYKNGDSFSGTKGELIL